MTALITGASSGIGAEFARQLARRNYDLILHGRRRELLEKNAEQLKRQFGVEVQIVTAELSDPAEIARLSRLILQTENLGFLVNNAGFGLPENFHDTPMAENQSMLAVHAQATIELTHAAIAVMLPGKNGTIVNVSSVAGFLISPKNVMYCATKAFLNSFSESLHLELHKTGVRVQALCPGFTHTDFHERMGYDADDPRFRHFMSAATVVQASFSDLARKKPVCVPGWKYKLVSILLPIIPRSLLYRLILRFWH